MSIHDNDDGERRTGRPQAASHRDLLDVLRIGWRHASLLTLGIAAGVVVGLLYYVQKRPLYTSEAQVLVVSKHPDEVIGEGGHASHFDDFVTTQRILIQSPMIVEQAINQGKLRELKCFHAADGDLTEAIIKQLAVGRVSGESPGSPQRVLRLSFSGTVAGECGIVVNAIVESYRRLLDDTYRNMSEDTVKLIREARDVLETDVARKEDAYRRFREKSPMLWKGTQEVNPRQDRLTQIELQRSTLLLREAEYEGQLKTIDKAQQAGRSKEELCDLVFDLSSKLTPASGSHNAPSISTQLLPLLQEEETLDDNYGPNHPLVTSVRERIEASRSFLTLPSAGWGSPEAAARAKVPTRADLVVRYVAYLRQALDSARNSEQVLASLFEKEHQAARELNSYEVQDAEYRNGIARSQVLYDNLVKRLQEVSLAKDYGGYESRIIAPAGIGKKVSPKALLVFPASALLGLLGGLGAVFFAEATDRRFRTPDEIRRRLGVPIMGHVPTLRADEEVERRVAAAGGHDPMLVAYYQPRSPGAEACRAIRTALYFSSAGGQRKVIQITSPDSGDGKSTVAANVAVSLARSGKRTLLVDADLRKPQQQKLFGVSACIGLASVIGQNVEVADAIVESGIRDLWLLPCGPLPPDPAELLTSPRFSELLALLRERYDYVLIDSAPLLPLTDGCVVAAKADGLLLVVHAARSSRLAVDRAKEMLATLGAHVLGVVINGVDKRRGAAYGYGYEYDPGYEDPSDNQESEPAAASAGNGDLASVAAAPPK